MASASTSLMGGPPIGDPPDISRSNGNERTMPAWMDRTGTYGQRIILQLSAVGDGSLPKNPFVIGKSIEKECGGKIESANTEERGAKYVLKTRSAEQAKKLLQMSTLIDGTEVVVKPHPTLNKSRCVLSCRDAIDMTTDDIKNELSSIGVTDVRRITRKVENYRVNTPTLILTFQGTTIPRHVFFGPLRVETREYIPSPMICFKCCTYGHTKDKCPNPAVCQNCSGPHTLERDACKEEPRCKNCNGSHSPTSRKCPVYIKEEKIIKIKVEKGISFGEARKEFEKLHSEKSYSGVCSAQDRLNNIRKDDEIRLLREENLKLRELCKETEKDTELNKLRGELEQMRTMMIEFHKLKEEMEQIKAKAKTSYAISDDDHDQTMSEASEGDEMNPANDKTNHSTTKRKSPETDSDPDRRGSGDDRTSRTTVRDSSQVKRGRGRPRKQ